MHCEESGFDNRFSFGSQETSCRGCQDIYDQRNETGSLEKLLFEQTCDGYKRPAPICNEGYFLNETTNNCTKNETICESEYYYYEEDIDGIFTKGDCRVNFTNET